jgi:conjugal transfer ATP-binding protein TraC
MSAPRQFRGARLSALLPVLAHAAPEGLFLLDDSSLAFGFGCRPLPTADRGAADRLSVLLNQDWPKDTLLQVMLWASPDIEEPLARMHALRIGHADALLRETAAQRADFLRRGTDSALGPGSELRVRDLQVLVTVKLPIAAAVPTQAELNDCAELRVGAEQVLSTAGLQPQPLTADRYVRLLNTLLNWGAGAGWRDRILPECDPQRLIREQLLDLDRALDVDAKGLTVGECRVQTLSVKRFPDRVAFGIAACFLGDPLSGTRGERHNVLVCLNLHFPEPESARVRLSAERQWAANRQPTGPW